MRHFKILSIIVAAFMFVAITSAAAFAESADKEEYYIRGKIQIIKVETPKPTSEKSEVDELRSELIKWQNLAMQNEAELQKAAEVYKADKALMKGELKKQKGTINSLSGRVNDQDLRVASLEGTVKIQGEAIDAQNAENVTLAGIISDLDTAIEDQEDEIASLRDSITTLWAALIGTFVLFLFGFAYLYESAKKSRTVGEEAPPVEDNDQDETDGTPVIETIKGEQDQTPKDINIELADTLQDDSDQTPEADTDDPNAEPKDLGGSALIDDQDEGKKDETPEDVKTSKKKSETPSDNDTSSKTDNQTPVVSSDDDKSDDVQDKTPEKKDESKKTDKKSKKDKDSGDATQS